MPFRHNPIPDVECHFGRTDYVELGDTAVGAGQMRRRDREIIEIGECAALDCVMHRLQTLHCSLSEGGEKHK